MPPTLNLDNPSEGCDIDLVPHVAKERTVRAALSNSFGFGGTNASLIFKKVELTRRWAACAASVRIAGAIVLVVVLVLAAAAGITPFDRTRRPGPLPNASDA